MHFTQSSFSTRRRYTLQRLGLLTLALALCVATLNASRANGGDFGATTFASGPEQVRLLELYTSEGCSSCPPAERWLSGWTSHPELWQSVIPVVFHVDYWNYLGWDDPYSSSEWSARQRRHADEGGVQSVYTPGFVVDGQEWRGWFAKHDLPAQGGNAGNLEVEVRDNRLRAEYSSGHNLPTALSLEVALLGFDLSTPVRSGENRGRELTHQFSVLAHRRAPAESNEWNLPLPRTKVNSARLALAVWVTAAGRLQPLQATGGWLPQAD